MDINSSTKSSTPGVRSSTRINKRKSGCVDDAAEDSENLSPNPNQLTDYRRDMSNKKVKPAGEVTEVQTKASPGTGKKVTPGGKTRSNLPRRYNVQGQKQPLVSAVSSNNTDVKKPLVEYQTALKQGTTASKILTTAATSIKTVSSTILAKLKKYVSGSTGKLKIREIFDTVSIDDVKLTVIMNNLKKQQKSADFRIKSKCYEAAVKELRELCHSQTQQFIAVRESSVASESDVDTLIRESYEELVELANANASLQSNEKVLNAEVAKRSEEARKYLNEVKQYKEDSASLKRLEKEHKFLAEKCADEEKARAAAEGQLVAVERELRGIKESTSEQLRNAREQFEQTLDQSATRHQQELATLKSELDRRESATERTQQEKAALDQKSADLREEVIKLQSSLSESERSRMRLENDVAKLTVDVEKQREQLEVKEGDLRSTLKSLHEMQSRMDEDRNTLRDEKLSLQNRVRQLEEERLTTTTELATKKEECLSFVREIAQSREAFAAAESKLSLRETEMMQLKEVTMQLEVERELRSRAETRETEEKRERIAACAQLLATQAECGSRIKETEEKMSFEIQKLHGDLRTLVLERDTATEEASKQADIVMRLEGEVQQLRQAFDHAAVSQDTGAVEQLGRANGELEILRKRLREASDLKDMETGSATLKIKELEEKLKAGEVQRRKLHNTIQELRGNIRVFSRVRPFLPSDGVSGDSINAMPDPTIQVGHDGSSLRIYRAATADERAEDQAFTFDRTFGPSASQESIFQEVSEFVQSALDGYNVCLFSYGQTGSGKTHTMQGSGNGSMRGIIPRAMQQVGLYKNELESKGWSYEMEVSFIEIYNETIRDLLRTGSNSHDLKHEIKRDISGHTSITDITMLAVDPNNDEQMERIMEQAARHRSVAQTAMNERSSRSHSVFTLHLKASNVQQHVLLQGTLSLVDLAGSERLDRSGATGDRLKETVAINKSLSALADVFTAIANKQPHVPYRNSKLTYLLQPALSGDGKTLMMVNLSPTEESFYESLCSLRFAKQVNQCELGKPKRALRDTSSTPSSAPSSSSNGAVSSSSLMMSTASSSALANSIKNNGKMTKSSSHR